MTGSAQARKGRPRLRHRRLGVVATLFAASGAIATTASSPAAAQDEPDGEAIYQANCAACHGVEGEGGVGPVLQGIVDAHGVEDVKASVTNGIPPTMPAWGDLFSEEEIDAVVAYVATLEGEHAHDDEHDDGDDHGDGHGDEHDDGDGDGHDDEHDDGHDHGDPGTGQPAPPVQGKPGFTG